MTKQQSLRFLSIQRVRAFLSTGIHTTGRWGFFALILITVNSESLSAASWTSDGQININSHSFLTSPDQPPATYQSSGLIFETVPTLQWAGEDTRFRFKALANIDQTEPLTADRTQILAQELFVETRSKNLNLSLGVNTFNWGVTDAINPLDVINPRSYRNPLSPVKIGSLSCAITWTGDQQSFDAVYIPKQLPHTLPTTSSRYLPRDSSFANFSGEFQGRSATIQQSTEPLRFHYKDTSDPSHAMDHNWALRYQNTSSLGDLHLIAFQGLPSFPDFSNPEVRLTQTGWSPITYRLEPDVDLTPKYQRVNVLGVGFVTSIAGTVFKLAHASTSRTSSDYEISLPQTTVLGLERAFSAMGLDHIFILQYSQVRDLSTLTDSIYSTREFLDGAVLAALRTSSSIHWNLTLGLLSNPQTQARITQGEFQYRLNDIYQLHASLQQFSGKDGGLAHALETASNVDLGLSVYW